MRATRFAFAGLLASALLLAVGCAQSGGEGAAASGGEQIAKGNLRFVDGYAAGVEAGTSSGKPLMLFFTAEWCHFCHELANEAFTSPQVVKLSDNFVCVLVDADREQDVCRQFGVKGFPTIQFVSPQGAELNRIIGKRSSADVASEMQDALQSVARREGAAPAAVR